MLNVVQVGEKTFFRLPSGQIMGRDHALVLLNLILCSYEDWKEEDIEKFNHQMIDAYSGLLNPTPEPKKMLKNSHK